MQPEPMFEVLSQFLLEVRQQQSAGQLVALVLSKPAKGMQGSPRWDVRPLTVQGTPHWQWTHKDGWQELHENMPVEESLERLNSWIPDNYRDATLITTQGEVQFRQGKKSATIQRRRRDRVAPVPHHDRAKQYLIPEGVPVPFLVELGVMTPGGQVKADKQRKFRQINRYLEFVRDIYPHLPETGTLQVVDFGCGLSYLTFALQYFLRHVCDRDICVRGVDRNPSVIARCQSISEKLHLSGLEFECRSVDTQPLAEAVHLVVSLHACDTATDATLAWAASNRARAILSVPCCQHELALQLDSPPLTLITRHGILREQFSSLATDALRAAALQSIGYETEVIEFIDLEHTAKNLLIRAVRRDVNTREDGRCQQARTEYAALKELLGVSVLATDQLLDAVATAT